MIFRWWERHLLGLASRCPLAGPAAIKLDDHQNYSRLSRFKSSGMPAEAAPTNKTINF
jgi:hypothetical protein